jgi:pantoate--beta-alanine ligase
MQAARGEDRAAVLLESMRTTFQAESAIRIDYIAAVDPDTLLPIENVGPGALLAVAAYVGNTRLIDNILLESAAGNTGVPGNKES